MGAYFADHFVAAHQQVGSFSVVNQFGRLQKNGGNVASYFCTPDGRVVHAVAGPAPAKALLAEAQWAVEAYERTGPSSPDQPQKMAAAHREAGEDLALLSSGRTTSSERIHQLLAARGMPPLNEVYREIFEQIVGQRVTPPKPEIAEAESEFHQAKQQEVPILLVLFKGGDRAEIDRQWEQVVSREAAESQNLKALAECYVIVKLPLDLLPALSQHLGLRPYAAPGDGSPLFVIARSNGRQLSATATWANLHELVRQLAQGAVQEAKERPRTEAQLNQLLKLVEPVDDALAGQIRELSAEAGKSKR